MARVENEFREFVAGFADPLTRLAYLLTAGTSGDPAVLSADALARVRRQWRDAEMTGAPESLAVEALLSGCRIVGSSTCAATLDQTSVGGALNTRSR